MTKQEILGAIKKTAFAVFAAACFLVIVQAAHYYGESLFSRAPVVPEHAGESYYVLCIGSSHVKSYGWIPGYSYPDQLQELLSRKVLNAGRAGITHEEIVNELPQAIKKFHPRWVVLMMGEVLVGQIPAPPVREDSSVFFSIVPLSDEYTLGMMWAGYLSKRDHWGKIKANAKLLEEARTALLKLAANKERPATRPALGALALLLARTGHEVEAEAVLERIVLESGGSYDLLAGLISEELAAKTEPSKRLIAIRAELSRRKPDPESLGLALKAFEGSDPGNAGEVALRAAIRIAPGYMALIDRLETNSRPPRSLTAMKLEAFWQNPFNPLNPTKENFARMLPSDREFVQEFNHAFVSQTFEPAGSLTGESPQVVESNIRRAIAIVREAGALPILQTYPLTRSGFGELDVDKLIRRLARELDVPVADTSAELRRRLARERGESFFEKPGEIMADAHMNEKGNRLMAELVYGIIRAREPKP